MATNSNPSVMAVHGGFVVDAAEHYQRHRECGAEVERLLAQVGLFEWVRLEEAFADRGLESEPDRRGHGRRDLLDLGARVRQRQRRTKVHNAQVISEIWQTGSPDRPQFRPASIDLRARQMCRGGLVLERAENRDGLSHAVDDHRRHGQV